MEIDDIQFKDKVEGIVSEYLKSSAFTDRKLTDTPTDALQVVNKAYCDTKNVPYSSIVGEYLNGNGAFTLPQYITGTAGEDLLANDAVFFSNFTGDNTMASNTSTGGAGPSTLTGGSTSTRIAQPFTLSSTSSTRLSKVSIRLKKVGSPVDNILLTITSSLDGTVLASASLAGSSLTTSYASYTFTLSPEIAIPLNIGRNIQLARSGGSDGTNYYMTDGGGGSTGLLGNGARQYDGASWNGGYDNWNVGFIMTTSSGNFYKCRTDVAGFYESVNGFVKTTVLKDAIATVNVGMQQTLSGMTGRFQYLTDSPGLISQTPGTNLKEVGVAVSATSMEFSPMYLRNFKMGNSTHDVSVTGTQNIAHGLPVKPRFVRITMEAIAGTAILKSVGIYNGYLSRCIYTGAIGGANANATAVDSSIIYYYTSGTGTIYANATITTDDTNIILTWANSNSPTGTINFLWEAYS